MRSITKDTITNDLELMDFGLQLGCLPSTMQKKLHNHPRNIEMASFIFTTEWWDSCSKSREEKYEVVLDAVYSMGKKFTAKRLESMVQDQRLANQSQTRPPFVSTCSQYLEVNHRTFIESNPSNQIEERQLAICNAEGPVVEGVSRNGFNIVEISTEDEEDGANSMENSEDRGESRREFTVGMTNRTRDLGSHSGASAIPSQIDSDVFDRKTEQPIVGKARVDFVGSHDQKYNSIISCKEVDPFMEENKEAVNNVKVETETEAPRKILNGEEKLSRSDANDGYECLDSGLFNASAMSQTEVATSQTGDLNGQIGVFNRQSDVFNGQTGALNSQTCVANGQIGVFNRQSDVFNGQTGALNSQTCVANGQTGALNSQTCVANGQTGALNSQTCVANGQTGALNSQTCVANGQTGALNSQTCVANGQTGALNSQTCVANGQTGALNSQTCVANGQTGALNSQTCVANGQTGALNSQTCVANGQTGALNGQTGVVISHTGVFNGQTKLVTGQTGVVNGQTGLVNGQVNGQL